MLGGMLRQHLHAIACCLLPDPDLLVMDEPTAGMDIGARIAFWETMRTQTRHGRTILFAPLAFALQRQLPSSELSSSSAFLHISTNFTSTRAVPSTSPVLQPHSFKGRPAVEPQVFTPDLSGRLDALYAQ